uniref:Putative nudix hydrolase 7 (inferred by orthology to a C. elegans protein) n=1 Tax=Strongyloides venezuelensis TaxID=75913 RepID=A0A0K0F486_STRVS
MLKRVATSASTILINRNSKNLLLLRRGPTAKFVPHSYVFPGGVLEKDLDSQFPLHLTNYDEIEAPQVIPNGMENDFSIRVCSLRELFEETGLLFVTEKNSTKKGVLSASDDKILQNMQNKVKNNPLLFKDIFNDFNLDLEILKCWAHWLTPCTLPFQFETIFYMVDVDKDYKINLCTKEMVDFSWMNPGNVLSNPNVRNYLPPPQLYEMCKIHWSIHENYEKDLNLVWPQAIFSNDPIHPDIYAFPGDHLFIENIPEELKYKKRILTFEEIDSYSKDKKIHRILYNDLKGLQLSKMMVRNFGPNDENKPKILEYLLKFDSKK